MLRRAWLARGHLHITPSVARHATPQRALSSLADAIAGDHPQPRQQRDRGRQRQVSRHRENQRRRQDGDYLAAQRLAGRYVSTGEALEELCDAARMAGRIAIDTEFHLENTYYIRLALVQIAVGGDVYCVDPLALEGRLDPLYDVVCDASIQKLVHAASMDLRVFFEHSSRPAKNVFDTQVAAGMLGHGITAYGELVKMCCGVKLSKGATMSDWLKRPLDDDQLRYAEDDVLYLGSIADQLTEQLHERGRYGWFELECAKFETQHYYNEMLRNPRDLFPRLKKVKALGPAERAKAYRLVEWREHEAARQDKPAYFLLKDQALVEIAKLNPDSPEDLMQQGSRIVHPNLVRFNGKVIVRILRTPPSEHELLLSDQLLSGPAAPVEVTKKEMARANAVFSLLYAYFLSVCVVQEIEPNFVASQANLKQFVTEAVTGQLPVGLMGLDGLCGTTVRDSTAAGTELSILAPHHEILCGWRWVVAGESLMQFLRGEVSVSYDPDTCLPAWTAER